MKHFCESIHFQIQLQWEHPKAYVFDAKLSLSNEKFSTNISVPTVLFFLASTISSVLWRCLF